MGGPRRPREQARRGQGRDRLRRRLRPRLHAPGGREPRLGAHQADRGRRGRGRQRALARHPGPGVPPARVRGAAREGPRPARGGGSADVSVEASYYAGGGLAGAPVQWNAHSSEASFTPPGQDDFTFGTWRPWWSYWGGSGSSRYEALSGTTDGAGRHGARVVFESVRPARPSTVTISATVRDENQQAWSASQAILVHPRSTTSGCGRSARSSRQARSSRSRRSSATSMGSPRAAPDLARGVPHRVDPQEGPVGGGGGRPADRAARVGGVGLRLLGLRPRAGRHLQGPRAHRRRGGPPERDRADAVGRGRRAAEGRPGRRGGGDARPRQAHLRARR